MINQYLPFNCFTFIPHRILYGNIDIYVAPDSVPVLSKLNVTIIVVSRKDIEVITNLQQKNAVSGAL